MKCTLEKVIEDVQLLVSRIESRESAADQLLQQIVQLQSDLQSMRKYQEAVRSFNDLSEQLSTHPKGPLIRCLAAENKQLEQLRIENRTLYTSLDEHQSALDLIMKKYRSQVTKLMQTNQLETALKSSTMSSSNDSGGRKSGSEHQPSSDLAAGHLLTNGVESSSTKPPKSTLVLTQKMTALAAMAKDVCDRGDAYASELEAELHRLRSENAGLRELLMISSDYSVDSSDNVANLDPIPGASAPSAINDFDRPRPHYSVHNRPSYPLSADSCIPSYVNQDLRGASATNVYSRSFDAFSYPSSSSTDPRGGGGGYRDDLSMNRSNDIEDKDDVVTLWDNYDDEPNKQSGGEYALRGFPSRADRDHFDSSQD